MKLNPDRQYLELQLGLSAAPGYSLKQVVSRARQNLRLAHSGQKDIDWILGFEFFLSGSLQVENGMLVIYFIIPHDYQYELFEIDGQSEFNRPENLSNFAIDEDAKNIKSIKNEAKDYLNLNDQGLEFSAVKHDVIKAFKEDDAISRIYAGDSAHSIERGASSNTNGVKTSRPPLSNHPSHPKVWKISNLLSLLASDSQKDSEELEAVEDRPDSPVLVNPLVQKLKLGIKRSAEITSKAVEAMESASDVTMAIARIESDSGVSTHDARRFIGSRQGDFSIGVDGENYLFRGAVVRCSQVAQKSAIARVILKPSGGHFFDIAGTVVDSLADDSGKISVGNGRHMIRFAELDDMQRGILTILAGARFDLNLVLKEEISTSTLLRRPTLVVESLDWEVLKDKAINILLSHSFAPGKALLPFINTKQP